MKLRGAFFPLLSKNRLRFNINCFIVYVLPKILMLPTFISKKTQIENFKKLIRGSFKKWLGIPRSTSTSLVNLLLGTDGDRMHYFITCLGEKKATPNLFN